jgi:hypothetical protein
MAARAFVATGDNDEALTPCRLCPTMPHAWVEWPDSGGRVPCFLHLTLSDGTNVWQTHTLRADTPLDSVVDIAMPAICLYPIIFQPDNASVTAARIVRALAKMTGVANGTNTETSVVFRAPDNDPEEPQPWDDAASEALDDIISEHNDDDDDDNDEYEDDEDEDEDDDDDEMLDDD